MQRRWVGALAAAAVVAAGIGVALWRRAPVAVTFGEGVPLAVAVVRDRIVAAGIVPIGSLEQPVDGWLLAAGADGRAQWERRVPPDARLSAERPPDAHRADEPVKRWIVGLVPRPDGSLRAVGYHGRRGDRLGLDLLLLDPAGQVRSEAHLLQEVRFEPRAVVGLEDGGFAVAGWNEGALGALLARFGPDGELRWSRTYDPSVLKDAEGLAASGSDLALVGSVTRREGEPGLLGDDMVLLIVDGQGEPKRAHGSKLGRDRGAAVVAVGDGFIVAGVGSRRSFEALLWSFDGQGALKWERAFGPVEGGEYSFRSLLEVGDGFVAAGQALEGGQSYDVLVAKVARDGRPLWQRTFGGDELDVAYGVARLGEDLLIAAATDSFGSHVGGQKRHAWLLRLRGDGSRVW